MVRYFTSYYILYNFLLYANFCQYVKKGIMKRCAIMRFHRRTSVDRECMMVPKVLLDSVTFGGRLRTRQTELSGTIGGIRIRN